MTADVVTVTGEGATKNTELLTPCGTVIVCGTATSELSLDNDTKAPPAGAAPVNVTVPPTVPPPRTLAGDTVTDWRLTDVGGGGAAIVVVVVGDGVGTVTVQPE